VLYVVRGTVSIFYVRTLRKTVILMKISITAIMLPIFWIGKRLLRISRKGSFVLDEFYENPVICQKKVKITPLRGDFFFLK
jgi:hypothetical protein